MFIPLISPVTCFKVFSA